MIKRPINGGNPNATLVASAAQTASGNSGLIQGVNDYGASALILEIPVTAVSGTTPTLDLYFQQTLDGTNFRDIAHFTQITAVQTNPVYAKFALGNESLTDALLSNIGDATIAANSLGLPIISRQWRIKWVIGGTTPSFTFAVNAYYI